MKETLNKHAPGRAACSGACHWRRGGGRGAGGAQHAAGRVIGVGGGGGGKGRPSMLRTLICPLVLAACVQFDSPNEKKR